MDDDARDARGRFTPGNPGGPGNPGVRRMAELQAVIRETVTPDRLRALIASLMKAVIERQDVSAARVLLDRVLGRPRAEPVPEMPLQLPDGVVSSEDVARTAQALLSAMAAGDLAPEDAMKAAAVVEVARRAVETAQLEKRISDLEDRAQEVKR